MRNQTVIKWLGDALEASLQRTQVKPVLLGELRFLDQAADALGEGLCA